VTGVQTCALPISSVYFPDEYDILSAHAGGVLRVYGADGTMMAQPVVYLDSLFLRGLRISEVYNLNRLVSEISVRVADNLTSVFIPSWKTQERWIFSDSSSEMKTATTLVRQGKWEQAADVWGMMYDKETNRNRKVRLASNLALANECLDDIDNALAWITIAYELLPSKTQSELTILTVKYMGLLNDRKNNKSKLYEQLGLDPL
jgi:hypothetical protein